MLCAVSITLQLYIYTATHTAPSTIGSVSVLVESVGFWQMAELSPGEQVDEDADLMLDDLLTSVRVTYCSISTPLSTAYSKLSLATCRSLC